VWKCLCRVRVLPGRNTKVCHVWIILTSYGHQVYNMILHHTVLLCYTICQTCCRFLHLSKVHSLNTVYIKSCQRSCLHAKHVRENTERMKVSEMSNHMRFTVTLCTEFWNYYLDVKSFKTSSYFSVGTRREHRMR
jgi:hypothetical protein